MNQATDIYGVSDYLSISVPTVKRRIKAGTFPVPDSVEHGTEWWTIDQLDKYQTKLKKKTQGTRSRKK